MKTTYQHRLMQRGDGKFIIRSRDIPDPSGIHTERMLHSSPFDTPEQAREWIAKWADYKRRSDLLMAETMIDIFET